MVVLMSAYNGEEYIKEQLDSIIAQDYNNLSILIRDDGSTDATADILKDYAEKHSSIHYYQGENKGVWKSFFDLMHHVEEDAAYIAFSDQDDYWMPEKISKAVDILKKMEQNQPALYCSNTTPVNEKLEKIKTTIHYKDFKPSFGNAIIQNINTGCTCVINRKLLETAVVEEPKFMVMHDWWLYLIAACYGNVYFDEDSYILYRQHGENSIGARTTSMERWKYRFRTFGKTRGNIYRQDAEFERIFKMNRENKELIKLVLATKHNLKYRLKMIMDKRIYRQSKSDDWIYKLLILVGKA